MSAIIPGAGTVIDGKVRNHVVIDDGSDAVETGLMADEVAARNPAAVSHDRYGFALVDYALAAA